MNNGNKISIVSGSNGKGNGNGAQLDKAGIEKLLKNDDRYFGWSVSELNDNGVTLSKFDAGSGSQHYMPVSRQDLQRLYGATKPNTIKLKD